MYTNLGYDIKATAMLSQALQITINIEDTYNKILLLTNIAEVYVDAKNKMASNKLLSQALRFINSIKNSKEKVLLLTRIGVVYAQIEKDISDEKRKILHEIIQHVLSKSMSMIDNRVAAPKVCKQELSFIRTLEVAYNADNNRYGSLGDIGWAPFTGSKEKLPYEFKVYFSGNTFTAKCSVKIDNDSKLEIWTINHLNILKHVSSD